MDEKDLTEEWRRGLVVENNAAVRIFTRDQLAAVVGQTWTTEELQRDFRVLAFLAPFVEVERKADGVRGTLEFGHSPRLYWGFRPNNVS